MTRFVLSQALLIVCLSLKWSRSISQPCLASNKLGPFVYSLGASMHVGICARVFKEEAASKNPEDLLNV